MKVTMIITAQMTDTQLENSYLLALALLNFDHQVSLIFVQPVFQHLMSTPMTSKRWLALKTYGIQKFYMLRNDETAVRCDLSSEHCMLIDRKAFGAIKAEMDLLL